jgi:hypothetical protein
MVTATAIYPPFLSLSISPYVLCKVAFSARLWFTRCYGKISSVTLKDNIPERKTVQFCNLGSGGKSGTSTKFFYKLLLLEVVQGKVTMKP